MARKLLCGLVVMTALILWGCGSGEFPIPKPPEIKLPIVEFPQHKLDFSIVTDKKVYIVGEPIIVAIKVKNDDSVPHSLTFEPLGKINPELKGLKKDVAELIKNSVGWYHFSGYFMKGLDIDTNGQSVEVTIEPKSEVEILKAVWRQDSDELNDPNELVGVGSYGIAAGLRLTKLDGKEPPPFNAGYGPIGKLDPLNPDLPIDGYGSLPYYLHRIRITHPVIEALMERGIFLSGVAYDVLDRNRPVPILAGIINTSKVSRTVTIKPISNYPTVRIRVFGPIWPLYPPKSRPLVVMRERREEIHVTIEPKRGYKVLEFFWDLRDERTGQILPPENAALAVMEFCGEFWVDGERIGVIGEPLKVFADRIRTGYEKQVTILPEPIGGGGSPPTKPSEPSDKPPKPPEW